MRVKWGDLMLAFEYASGGGNSAVLCRDTGELLWHSEHYDNFDEWPDDVDDEDKFENEATERALEKWCDENGVEIVADVPSAPGTDRS